MAQCWLAVGDVGSRNLIKEIRFTDNVRPFVINMDATIIYANINNLLVFRSRDKLLDMTFRDGQLRSVASQFGNGQILTAPNSK